MHDLEMRSKAYPLYENSKQSNIPLTARKMLASRTYSHITLFAQSKYL